MVQIAAIYQATDDGLPQDYKNEFEWSIKGANSDVDSMYFVSLNYYDGQGTERNLQRAVQWLSRALNHGHEGAQEKLLEMFLTGELQATAFKSLSDRLKKLESKK